MPATRHDLTQRRRLIDRIDAQLLRLLNQRMRVAQDIGRVKQQLGNRRVDRRRERAILARLQRANCGPLTRQALQAVYRQIFLHTRAVQRPRRSA